MSGYDAEEDIKKGEQAGFNADLVKPVNFDQLNERFVAWPGRTEVTTQD